MRMGRGEGLLDDEPGLMLFGDIGPGDVTQGRIGDCWLMSSMSACAEFEGMISRLFTQKELSEEGRYSIKLFDIPSKVALITCTRTIHAQF